ncbi:MAG: site-specific integrase [Armatimonadota bacterium]
MSGTRGSIRNRGDHRWQITYELQKDASGKRKQGYETVRGTKRDAQRRLNEILAEIQAGKYIEPSKLKLADFLAQWLEFAKATLAEKTREEYAKIIHTHINPNIGNILLFELRPLHIQKYYNDRYENGRIVKPVKPLKEGEPKPKPKGLSALTVRHHHTLLHKALADAVAWHLIPSNPADAAKPPKQTKSEMKILNKDEIKKLLDHARPHNYNIAIVLAISTGMRRGEILALRWKDVNLDAKTITVSRSLQQTDGRKLTIKGTKTGKNRVIPISQKTVDELMKQKARQAQNKLLLGREYKVTGLVCSRPDGSMVVPDLLTDAFRTMVSHLDITQIRFHDLRHTHVALLIAQGEHVKVISERLGHSSISITMDRYGHLFPTLNQSVADKFDEALGW